MRILHITDVYRPAVGGIEVFVEELAHQQHAAGHEVSVLTRARGASAFSDDVAVIGYGSREVRLNDFDVVHAHLSVLSPMTSMVMRQATVRRVPVVATVHSMWAGRGAIVKAVAVAAGWQRHQPVWTAVSSIAAREVHDLLPGANVHVVPNAVDVNYWREGIATPYEVSVPEVPTLLAVNRLAPRKRPMALLHQLVEVRRMAPDQPFRARIVGAGPLEKRMRGWIDHHGMHDIVTLTGGVARSEVRRMCHSADLFVAPAHQESFGIAALEGRAAGLPVLAMSSGGVGEFVHDGVDGVLCDDDHAMAAAIVRLLKDRDEWLRMARHNHEVPPNYGWDRTLVGFSEAYAAAGADGGAGGIRTREGY